MNPPLKDPSLVKGQQNRLLIRVEHLDQGLFGITFSGRGKHELYLRTISFKPTARSLARAPNGKIKGSLSIKSAGMLWDGITMLKRPVRSG